MSWSSPFIKHLSFRKIQDLIVSLAIILESKNAEQPPNFVRLLKLFRNVVSFLSENTLLQAFDFHDRGQRQISVPSFRGGAMICISMIINPGPKEA